MGDSYYPTGEVITISGIASTLLDTADYLYTSETGRGPGTVGLFTIDGEDAGDTSPWEFNSIVKEAGNNLVLDAAAKHGVGNGYKVSFGGTNEGCYGIKSGFGQNQNFYYREYIYFPSSNYPYSTEGTGREVIFTRILEDSYVCLTIYLTLGSSGIYITKYGYRTSGYNSQAITPIPVSTGEWHWIDFYYRPSPDGAAGIWLDGIEVMTRDIASSGLSGCNITWSGLTGGVYNPLNGEYFYLDDIKGDTSYIGPYYEISPKIAGTAASEINNVTIFTELLKAGALQFGDSLLTKEDVTLSADFVLEGSSAILSPTISTVSEYISTGSIVASGASSTEPQHAIIFLELLKGAAHQFGNNTLTMQGVTVDADFILESEALQFGNNVVTKKNVTLDANTILESSSAILSPTISTVSEYISTGTGTITVSGAAAIESTNVTIFVELLRGAAHQFGNNTSTMQDVVLEADFVLEGSSAIFGDSLTTQEDVTLYADFVLESSSAILSPTISTGVEYISTGTGTITASGTAATQFSDVTIFVELLKAATLQFGNNIATTKNVTLDVGFMLEGSSAMFEPTVSIPEYIGTGAITISGSAAIESQNITIFVELLKGGAHQFGTLTATHIVLSSTGPLRSSAKTLGPIASAILEYTSTGTITSSGTAATEAQHAIIFAELLESKALLFGTLVGTDIILFADDSLRGSAKILDPTIITTAEYSSTATGTITASGTAAIESGNFISVELLKGGAHHFGTIVGTDTTLSANVSLRGSAKILDPTIITTHEYTSTGTIAASGTALALEVLTYYVDYTNSEGTSSDSNDGLTTISAWIHCPGDTAYAGSGSLSPGNTVYFKKGITYSGQIATQADYVAYLTTSWGSGTASFDGIGKDACFKINHGHITIDDFDLTGTTINQAAIWVSGSKSLSGSTFTNLTIHNIGDSTSAVGAGIRVEGDTFVNDDYEISNCSIYSCYSKAIDISGYGSIHNNTIYSNGGNGLYLNPGYNVSYSGTIEVYQNKIYNNSGQGLNVGKTSSNSYLNIYNNILYNNTTAGMNFSVNAKNNFIYHNTVYQGAAGWGLRIQSGATGNTIKNNIFEAFSYAIYDSTGNITEDFNVCDSSGANIVVWNGTAYSSISTYRAASGQGASSIWADPEFTNAANGDFSLKSTSPAVDSGIDLGITTDYFGNLRPWGDTYDIGAIEFYPFYSGTGEIVVSGAAGIVVEIDDYSYKGRGKVTISGLATTEEAYFYSYSATGEIVTSGTAQKQFDLSYTSFGTIVISGSSISYSGHVYTSAGEITVSGTAESEEANFYWYSGTGKIVISETFEAEEVNFYTYSGTGTVVISGASSTYYGFEYPGTGKIIISGAGGTLVAGTPIDFEFIPTGAVITVSGVAVLEQSDFYSISSGSIYIQGSSQYNLAEFGAYTPTGQVTVSGTATSSLDIAHYIYSISGTITASGIATTETASSYAYSTSGSITISGSIVVGPLSSHFLYSSTGTITISGTSVAEEANDYTYSATGTIIVSGAAAAETTANYAYSATDTIVVSGAAITETTAYIAYSASGSIIVSGTAAAEITANYTYSASGTIIVSGTIPKEFEASYSSAGTITISGASHTQAIIEYASTGLVIISGTAATEASIGYTSTGTITISGTAATEVEISYSASGSVIISGTSAIEESNFYSYSSTGEIIITGEAQSTIEKTYIGIGSLELSGAANTFVDYKNFIYLATDKINIDGIAQTIGYITAIYNASGTIELRSFAVVTGFTPAGPLIKFLEIIEEIETDVIFNYFDDFFKMI